MAYVSLYRKYRPQTFAQIVGQQHVTRTLAHALETDRLHHAYLFTGPRGTGKTSTARILAKSLNCEQGPTAEPDNTCTHCRAITAGSSIDVIEIDAASHGGVDDVRDLRDRVAFAPASARSKVYIVDECHMLSTAGWNAFLKTVEEPPGHVMFVFATTEPHKVLDTILSRTQRFDFKRIPAAKLSEHIRWVGEQEGITFESGAVELIVQAGDGSARDAMSVLEQVSAFTGATVTVEGVTEVLGASPHSALDAMVNAISVGDVAAACLLIQRLADAGHDLRQFSKDAIDHLRAVFMLQVAPQAGLIEGTTERLASLREQAAMVGRAELLRAMELLADSQAQMRRGNTRLPLEIALAKACLPDYSRDAAALGARLDRLERQGLAAPAADSPEQPVFAAPSATASSEVSATDARSAVAEPNARQPAPEEPPPAPVSPPAEDQRSVDLASVQGSWAAVMDLVKGSSKRVHAMASLATPSEFSGDSILLRFPAGYGFHAEQCGSARSQDIIGGALEQILGVRPRVTCVVEDGHEPPPAVAQTVDEARVAEEAAAVAETEAAEEAGDVPDPAEAHRRAVELVERDLGGRLLDSGETA